MMLPPRDVQIWTQQAQRDRLAAEGVFAEDEMKALLLKEGCGAFVGRGTCGEPVAGFTTGNVLLRFQTSMGCWDGLGPSPTGRYVVGLCLRHGGPSLSRTEAQRRLLLDVDGETLESQVRECRDWLASFNITLETGQAPS
jgi:hypothetical protein